MAQRTIVSVVLAAAMLCSFVLPVSAQAPTTGEASNYTSLAASLGFLLELLTQLQESLGMNVSAAVMQQPWKPGTESIQEGKIQPAGKILEVALSFNTDLNPPLTFKDIKKKNGYAPRPEAVSQGYILQALNGQGGVLQSIPFEIPNILKGPPPLPGDISTGVVVLKKGNFALTLPFSEDIQTLRILDPQARVLVMRTIGAVPSLENTQDFYTVSADELIGTSVESQSEAAASVPKLDITFIGDDYTAANLTRFHTDVTNFSNHLLAYQPFKSRSAQIVFHYVDNTSDLRCLRSYPTIPRLLSCDDAVVTERVNDAGVPYDKIFVIVNTAEYGGVGGNIAVAYNGTYGKQAFVHEFGHSFTNLWDEYNVYSSNSSLDRQTYANCFAGTGSASAWAGVVGSGDYALGCTYPNWRRSSPTSIMRELVAPYFNAVSQKYINLALDFYAGVFTDTVLPVSSIVEPANGAIVSGTVTVRSTAVDNKGIAWVQLWVDGRLFRTVYKTPYNFSWNTANLAAGNHTLQVKAYDAKGNVGSSAVITVRK